MIAPEKGYMALMAVLVVGAVATVISFSLLMTGTDASRSGLVDQEAGRARKLADACAEEALQLIHDTTSFTGNSNLTLSTGTCTYAVTSTGSNTRLINATGTVNNVVRKIKVYVTINSASLSVTSWQEVAEL